MIQALRLCSLALNPSSPSPTATLVKVEGGFMKAYGGSFCISVPVNQEIGAAFDPKSLATFFRKPRTTVSYTIKFPKLTVKEGKERLTVNCLPAEDLAIIDNIEKPTPCTLNIPNLKIAAELIDPAAPAFAQGVTFRDEAVMATNNKVFFCGEAGLDAEFAIHKEAALALCKFKSPVVAYAHNDHTIKFIFKDGSSLCAHKLTELLPDISHLFEGEWTDFKITEDLLDLDCDYVKIIDRSLTFHTDSSIGELEDAVEGNAKVCCTKKHLNHLLKLNTSLSYIENQRIKAEGENSVMICSMLRE